MFSNLCTYINLYMYFFNYSWHQQRKRYWWWLAENFNIDDQLCGRSIGFPMNPSCPINKELKAERCNGNVTGTCIVMTNFTSKSALSWQKDASVSAQSSRALHQAFVPIVRLSTCRRREWLGSQFLITDRMLCAGYENGQVDSCQVRFRTKQLFN